MIRKKMAAHLKTVMGKKRCSICNKIFSNEVKPSLSKAFAEHVRQEHKGMASSKQEPQSSRD
jgi:hypothetical protein